MVFGSSKTNVPQRRQNTKLWQMLQLNFNFLGSIQDLLGELGIRIAQPPNLYCENTGGTYLCANSVYHSRTKHMALDYHFVRELVYEGSLRLLHISSKDQIADVLTKQLARRMFLNFRSKIGVSDGSSIFRGRVKDNGKA
ncbi:hypothetical protein Tco_0357326 [Tanacetum coccineum]